MFPQNVILIFDFLMFNTLHIKITTIMFLSISYNPATTSSSYLICIELSFLAESWRHVLGLNLLLGRMVLVLVEKMLVLNLSRVTWV